MGIEGRGRQMCEYGQGSERDERNRDEKFVCGCKRILTGWERERGGGEENGL